MNSKTVVGTTSLKGVMRWMAPELVMLGEGKSSGHPFHTKATDVWAFGLVVYVCATRPANASSTLTACQEAMAGNIPFYTHSDAQAVVSIMNRKLPDKPKSRRISGSGLELLWGCCNACWKHDPARRPTVTGVRDFLEMKEPVNVSWRRASPFGRLTECESGMPRHAHM